ncbi:MAG: hypothetical protein GC178_05300 [Flavobacteriales bacterium]|nr:hypothetical protein [Flavobacteriales bacterium]
MGNRSNIGIIVLVVLVVVGMIALVYFLMPKHNWNETLSTHADEPYDLTLFKALLDSSTTGELITTDIPITDWLDTAQGCNYFLFGNNAYFDSAEVAALFHFMERGNNVFIAANRMPQELFDEASDRNIFIGGEDWAEGSTVFPVASNFGNTHQYGYKGPFGIDDKWWSFINTDPNYVFDDEYDDEEYDEEYSEEEVSESVEEDTAYVADLIIDSLGQVQDSTYLAETSDSLTTETQDWEYMEVMGFFRTETGKDTMFINFLATDIGKGRLYLHTNPIMFSNFFLMKKDGFEYTNEVLSSLGSRPSVWDDYHLVYRPKPGEETYEARTPLRFIFAHPPLKYAWLTLVASVILFLMFRSKREQKPIPIIPAVENTSIAFAKSLGVLYHNATSGRFLAVELMRMFDNFNRRHYRYNRNKKDEQTALHISKKARVDLALVEDILRLERTIVYNPISKVKEVVKLYNRLEDYYKQAKR